MSLGGRVVIITGAAGGLGRAYAALFAREGAHLVLNDRGPGLDELVREIEGRGGHAVAHYGDVGDEVTADQLVELAVDAFGSLDVVVNNAGNFAEAPLVETSVEDWDALTRVHLRGHFLLTRAVARHWKAAWEAGADVRAAVVNTTSRSAINAIGGHSAYGAAKAGVVTLSLIAAKELAPYGVRVNCVAPAARTPMLLRVRAMAEQLATPVDADSFDSWAPANVAPLVAYLATRDCPLTGQVLFCRGGMVQPYHPWGLGAALERDRPWEIAELAEELPRSIREGV